MISAILHLGMDNKNQCNYSLLVDMSSFAEDSLYNITETYHPRYRKGEFKHLLLNRNRSSPAQPQKQLKVELSDAILHNFRALGGFINNLDELFKARMTVHEEEIIQIAHSEIKKIQLESQGIIKMYSDMIRAKNISSEILDLKYEVKYYQKRACQMFEQNKELKQKIKNLQAEIGMFKLEQQASHIALRNVSKKYLKEKVIRRNIEMGSLKRRLIREPSDSNIKISLLSRSAAHTNPEKEDSYDNPPLSPTRQDSTKSKHKAGYSSSKKRQEDNKSIEDAQIKLRVRTEPARDYLPPVVKFK